MKIITNCETIDLSEYDRMEFCFEKATVRFSMPDFCHALFFNTPREAKEFISEIIEGYYNRMNEIDLSHIMTVPDYISLRTLEYEIESRLTNHKFSEDEDK